MPKEKWIQGAIKHKGALTAQAKASGKSISEFCASGNKDLKTKKRCILAKTLKKISKK